MSTLRPWILTESQKACIHVHECDFLGELGFPWTYTVDVGGFTYPGKHTHPTRRAAWAAAKSYFKSLSESKKMKIYVLMRHIDYEGSDVLAVYMDKSVADAWLKWMTDNRQELRSSIGENNGLYAREWEGLFPHCPADGYSVEEHEMRVSLPSLAAAEDKSQ